MRWALQWPVKLHQRKKTSRIRLADSLSAFVPYAVSGWFVLTFNRVGKQAAGSFAHFV